MPATGKVIDVNRLAGGLAAVIDAAVKGVVIPVTSVIPVLIRTGALFVLFLVLWAAFLVALVADPARLADAWQVLTGLPFPLQGVLWLLFLPLTAGLWAWSTDWAVVVRVVVVLGLAGWNVLIFRPRRESAATPVAA